MKRTKWRWLCRPTQPLIPAVSADLDWRRTWAVVVHEQHAALAYFAVVGALGVSWGTAVLGA